MNEILTIDATVCYREVDREEKMLLSSLFKHLQDAAITHADQYDIGARAMSSRGESWVLHRLAAVIHRFPDYGETVRVRTWSSGIRAFRGYRDFRVHAGDELLVAASSLWLYVKIATRSLIRVPADVAAGFPAHPVDVFRPDLDALKFAAATDERQSAIDISVRYSDIDANGHVNNTAYFDYLQTALARRGLPTRPRSVEIQFAREIPPDTGSVPVRLEPGASATAFSVGEPAAPFALGRVA